MADVEGIKLRHNGANRARLSHQCQDVTIARCQCTESIGGSTKPSEDCFAFTTGEVCDHTVGPCDVRAIGMLRGERSGVDRTRWDGFDWQSTDNRPDLRISVGHVWRGSSIVRTRAVPRSDDPRLKRWLLAWLVCFGSRRTIRFRFIGRRRRRSRPARRTLNGRVCARPVGSELVPPGTLRASR